MSGFVSRPPSTSSNVFNPSFYSDAAKTLSLDQAEELFCSLYDSRLGYLSGVSGGTVAPNKAVVTNATNDITGLGLITCTSLTVNGLAVSGGSSVSVAPWSMVGTTNNVNSCSIDITCPSNGYSAQSINIKCADAATYNNSILTFTNNYWAGGLQLKVDNTANNTDTSRYVLKTANGEALAITARTGSSNNYDLFFHPNQGVISLGKGTLINSNHRLEVNGSVLIGNTASTYNLGNTPRLGIQNAGQASTTTQDYIFYGKDVLATTCSSWKIGAYYQSTTPDQVNYTYWTPVTMTGLCGAGLTMTMDGRVNISMDSTRVTNPNAVLELTGYKSNSFGQRFYATPTTYGNTATSSGSIPMAFSATGGYVWSAYGFIASSDIRVKKDMEQIGDNHALQLLKCSPITYKYKNSADEKRRYGIVAQELLRNDLEMLVDYIPNDTMEEEVDEFGKTSPAEYQMVVAYDRLCPLLLKICKMQQASLETLVAQVKDLESDASVKQEQIDRLVQLLPKTKKLQYTGATDL